mmetsp:Transcript_9952/g.21702  ORF Transcript_9952/g.21702 Transcript_9952/m.21702 type:complete len:412 (+) Transcript_9952:117-1352(+)
MAAFNRPTKASYEIHEHATIDTQDNEDHTFCGIMFPVKCKDLLPLDHLVIKSVAVRGELGPLTVWVSKPEEHRNNNYNPANNQQNPNNRRWNNNNNNNNNNDTLQQRIRLNQRYWNKLYDQEHAPSRRQYKELTLTEPIRLRPGETRVIYIHSTLPGDEAIVYDNSEYGMSSKRYEDDKLAIMTGRAHVSNDVFGQEPIWGWGNAWRDRREFVGRLEYGTVYKLWNPQVQLKFGGNFQTGARALFLCQRRWESPLSLLPDECLFYILNMCRWDWFDDDSESMKERRRREKARNAIRAAEETQRQLAQNRQAAPEPMEEEVAAAAAAQERNADSGLPCSGHCNNAESEEFEDAQEEEEEENEAEDEEMEDEEQEGDDDQWDSAEEDDDDDDDDDDEATKFATTTFIIRAPNV